MVSIKRREPVTTKVTNAALRGIQKARTKDLDLLIWIKKTKINLRGNPFSFHGHEYLREIYQQHHDDEVYMKGAQVGISTYHLLKSLWLCDTHHAKVIYFFPTDTDVSDFSNDRARVILEENEYLRSRVSGIDNVGLKQIGDSSVYFRGMFSRRRVKSVDADYIILDELDEADPENKEYAKDRILHSQLRWTSQLSQPSVPDFGIHQEFEESDQRVWSLQCDHCNHWNHFDPNKPNEAWEFAEKFLYKGSWHCVKCGRPIHPKKSEWIPLYPSRSEKRGYHLTQLYSEIIPVQKIARAIEKARAKRILRMRIFNSIFGIPYTDEIRQPITDDVIKTFEGDQGYLPQAQMTYMGVDVGDILHIVIAQDLGEKIQIVHIEHTDDWGRLKSLMSRFGVWQCIIDAMPYKNSAKQFAREFPDRVVLQYFKSSREERGDEIEKKEEDEGNKKVTVIRIGRTESIDETTDIVREGRFIFPDPVKLQFRELQTYDLFKSHLKKLIKDLKEDDKGRRWFEYKHNVENHFGMALNSLRLAMEYTRLYGRRFYGAGAAYTRINP